MTTPRRAPYLVSRLQGLGTSIFAEMSALAVRTGAINLGQGFPDTDGPTEVAEAAVAAIRGGHNQYPPGIGTPELRAAISAHQKRFYGLTVDPDTEVLVTAGATEAITAAILALCEPGDEVITFEPYYDSYAAAVALAAARHRVVPLQAPSWRFDPERLAAAVTPRTRVLLLNSPNNPTGKVFDADELAAIAALCVETDLIAVTDEVYEHLIFDGVHRPLATFPGMAERTITISSAGKTFSFTGWKIGWACGPAPLVAAVRTIKQFLTYVNGAPFQPAVAVGLGLPDSFFHDAAAQLRDRRDQLCAGLESVGLDVIRPAAGYFVIADIGALGLHDGVEFCRQLPARAGVAAIPAAAFYDVAAFSDHAASSDHAPSPDHAAFSDHAASSDHAALDTRQAAVRRLVRFAYCKRPAVLAEAINRLAVLANERPIARRGVGPATGAGAGGRDWAGGGG